MNTKSKKIKTRINNILRFESEAERNEHDSKILMFKFLSIVEERMSESLMTKKELAELLGTSPSYVTQLFRGTKTINLLTIAKLQRIFNIKFNIAAEQEVEVRISRKKNRANPKKQTVVA